MIKPYKSSSVLRQDLQVVLRQLAHKRLIRLHFLNELSQCMQAVLQLDPFLANQVRQDERRRPAFALD